MIINKELIQEFLDFYKNQNFKKDTIRGYELEFQRFNTYLNFLHITDTDQISMKIIENYKTLLTNQKTTKNSIYYGQKTLLSPRTVQTKLQPVKKFLEFLNIVYNTGLNYQWIKVPKVYSKHMDFFEEYEIKEILHKIEENEKNALSKARAKLLVVVGFVSGLRLSEMLQLKASDIMKGKAIILGKGDKEREVYFNDTCKEIMQEYLEARKGRLPSTGCICKRKCKEVRAFISHSPVSFGKKVAINTLCEHNKAINDYVKIEGKKFSAHTMRHSSATFMLDNGVNIREIQVFLGHSNLETTESYTHIRNKQVEQTHSKVFGNF